MTDGATAVFAALGLNERCSPIGFAKAPTALPGAKDGTQLRRC
jgi:hypothetical protein